MYARNTTVGTDKTRAEIEKLLKKCGASHFGYMSEPGKAQIAFVSANRRVKFTVPMPTRGTERKVKAEERRRWRSLLLSVKGKLVGVADGVETFEEAFLAHIVTNEGPTVMEAMRAMQGSGEGGLLLLAAVK